MLWFKALHLIFMVTWFAGLFYLPRLFVYHAQANDNISHERFKIMERKLFWGIMTPGALLTIGFGTVTLVSSWDAWGTATWMHLKLALIASLVVYHIWCGKLVKDFKLDRNIRSHVWFRWFNEAPVLVLVAIVILAVVKPF